MRKLWLVLLLLLLVAAAVGPRLAAPQREAARTLTILSPHWDGIREEFRRGFEAWWEQKTGERVRVDFLDVGGTGQTVKYIRERAKASKAGGAGADLFFGGGTFDYIGLASDGLLEAYDPPAVARERIPATLNGLPLRDKDNHWHAACLSGFGIVYNKEVVARAGLPVPETWATMADPKYLGWISCGDPAQSGSVQMAFEIVLQSYGWEQGWSVLARMMGNASALNEGGASVPRDVSMGQAAAGPCIDFYAAAPVRRQGATHLAFVFPDKLSAITPDAIAVLKKAPQPDLARAFVDYVLSAAPGEGQHLWYGKRGSEGGPVAFDLERLPVVPSMYEKNLPTYTVARPFEEGAAFRYDERKSGKRWNLMRDGLLRGCFVEVHEDLRAAWEAVVKNGRVEDLGPAFGRAPLSEEAAAALAGKTRAAKDLNAARTALTGWARRHFRAIRAAAEHNGPVPAYEPAALKE